MTYSIKAKLMIAVTSATVLGISAFIQPAEAAPPSPQPYSLPSTNEFIIKAQFGLIDTNEFELPIKDEKDNINEGLFKSAIKNFIGGVGIICTTEKDQNNDICQKESSGTDSLGKFLLDKYNNPIFLGYKGDACTTNSDSQISGSTDILSGEKGFFKPCEKEKLGDLDLQSQFFAVGQDPLAEKNENDFKSAAIAYTIGNENEKEGDILSFRLDLGNIPGINNDKCSTVDGFLDAEDCQPVREAVNNLEFIRANNLLGKASPVVNCSSSSSISRRGVTCTKDQDGNFIPSIPGGGAGKAVLLPNSTATVAEPSMTIGAFVSVGAGLLLKRKTKQQPKQ